MRELPESDPPIIFGLNKGLLITISKSFFHMGLFLSCIIGEFTEMEGMREWSTG